MKTKTRRKRTRKSAEPKECDKIIIDDLEWLRAASHDINSTFLFEMEDENIDPIPIKELLHSVSCPLILSGQSISHLQLEHLKVIIALSAI